MAATAPEEIVVNEIVSLAKIMGLEVEKNDINEYVVEHNEELTTEELMELQCASQQEAVDESLSGEEEVKVKQQSYNSNKRNTKSMGSCCIVH
ncbi:hypothetical protein AVEN_129354-1 [Araneus ventricosus]|uniref:Uncharacterized protein n=1 Tax=Araneus ventricosus TaxID=182803 RepID=A0A4Y2QKF4_ARAVE|nr:hypothetical protein AVEN_129354-1 [Araneus ventricosus]